MPDLTLEQVKAAGRFAWCEVRSPAETRGGPDDYREDWTRRENGELEVEVIGNNASVNGMPPVPSDGWHHADGCDCEFCEPHAPPITRHLALPGCGCPYCKET